METEQVTNLVIGSGGAGKYLAWTLAKSGRLTTMVERKLIDGSCLNIACLPIKNVNHSARVASLVNRAVEFGISTGPVRVEMPRVISRKRKMVDNLIAAHRQHYH